MLMVVAVLCGLALTYIGYLHLQLYISRRIIHALQETTVTAEAEGRSGLKPALAVFGLLLLAAGALASGLQ